MPNGIPAMVGERSLYMDDKRHPGKLMELPDKYNKWSQSKRKEKRNKKEEEKKGHTHLR